MNGVRGIQPGREPGTFIVGGQVRRIVDWTHRFLYDTVSYSAGASITAGDEDEVFRNVQNKDKRRTNLTQGSQLPSDWEAIIMAVMIQLKPATAYGSIDREELYGDFYELIRSGYFSFTVGNTTLVTEGTLDLFPCPFGTFLQVASDQAPAVEDTANVWMTTNNGQPHGNPRSLIFPVHVTPDLTFEGLLRWYDAASLQNAWDIRVILDALVKRPVR